MNGASSSRPRSAEPKHNLPLTPMQQGMLYHRLRAPGSGVDVEQIVVRMKETLDVPRLHRAFDMVVARHDALRASFAWHARETPAQNVRSSARVPLSTFDLSTQVKEMQELHLRGFLRRDRATDFDMREAPLMRLATFNFGNHGHVVVWSFHHILLDGRSFPLVLGEVFDAYDALQGGATPLRRPEHSFVDFLGTIEEHTPPAAEAYYRDLLQGVSAPTPLEVGFVSREPATPDERSVSMRLSAEETQAFVAAAKLAGVRPSTLFDAAWALLLRKYSGQDDVLFGSTRACRDPRIEGVRDMIGLLINTVPMRVRMEPQQTLGELLQALRAQQVALRDHERVSLSEIQRFAQLPAGMALFDSIAVFDVATIDQMMKQRSPRFADMSFEYLGQTNFPLTLAGYLDPELLVRLEFDPARFDLRTARRMMQHFAGLLCTVARLGAQDLSVAVADIPVLSSEEKRQLIERWNATDLPFAGDQRMHDAFQRRAAAAPGAVACVCRGESLGYGELEARANALAHLLQARGVGRGDKIGLCLPRSFDLIVSMLAVLKAGAGYVPLDPAYPLDRTSFMLEDTRAKLVLTQTSLTDRLPPGVCELVCLDQLRTELAQQPSSAPVCDATSDDVAYIIYTSGSTGRPKGVVVRHRPAINLINWVNETFKVGPNDRLLFVTSVCFDLSVYDVFGTLSAGGSMHIATPEELRDPRELVRLAASGDITFWDSAPATLAQLVPFLPVAERRSRLRLVFLSGDWIPVPLPDSVRAAFPNAEVVSLGGATEATIWSNFYRVGNVDTRWPSIPYGRPIQNARYYVLDDRLEPLPIGVPGQLYIGGYCLADGYHNRPDLNAEKFIDNPYLPGTKLYKTGDLSRFMPDGDIEFLGRLDFQVKVRGYRIELGEIEAVLNQDPAVATSLVDAPRANGVDRVLVAYLVKRGKGPNIDDLRARCQKRLPEYMVPAHFILLDQLPVTSNGKVDRKALPTPTANANSNFVAPRDELEAKVAKAFKQCLNVEKVGVHDNFFDLGGQSLAAVRLIGDLSNQLSIELSVGTLFDKPTVAGMAEAVRAGVGKAEAFIVPLNKGTSAVPLFFICGIHLYQDLANAIGDEHSSYGIFLPAENKVFSAGGTNGNGSSVEELARMYIEAIRRQYPRGPYLLAGVSFGGLLAYEMARQLTASQEEVPLLVLIDTILPSSVRLDARKWLEGNLSKLSLSKLSNRARALVRTLVSPEPEPEGVSEPDLEGMRRASYTRAAEQYEESTINSYAGRTLLIRAEQFEFTNYEVDSMLGWSKRLNGDVMVSSSPGNHLSVLREQRTADLIRRALDWVRRRNSLIPPPANDLITL